MQHSLRLVMTWLVFLLCTGQAFTQTGSIRGRVFDQKDGEPLIGATVLLVGTNQGTVVDLDGKYSMGRLAPGNYTLKISYVSYDTKTINNVAVKAGEATIINVGLNEANLGLGEITVEAERIDNTENALLLQRKSSANMLDGISKERIEQTGDINVALVLRRVTGVSVEGGRYAYVRGLGDRYSQTLLNGLQIPGLDPERNTVQLDLIPAQLLDNIIVVKTFSPDLPGNFTGGLVDISTAATSEDFSFSVSARADYNTITTFQDDFITYPGSNTDWLGFDDGRRSLPSQSVVGQYDDNQAIPPQTAIFISPEQSQFIADATRAFEPVFDPTRDAPPVDHRLAISIGNQHPLGSKYKFGYQASLSYIREYTNIRNARDEQYVVLEGGVATEDIEPRQALEIDEGRDEVLWGGLLSTSLKMGSFNKLGLNLIYNQSGQQRTIEGGGEDVNNQAGDYLSVSSLLYEERQLVSYQLFGDHSLGKNHNFTINWSGAFTQSAIDQPDLRFFRHSDNNPEALAFFQETGDFPPVDGRVRRAEGLVPTRYFRDLDEDTFNGKIDFTYEFNLGQVQGIKFKTGANYLLKDRTFREYNYEYDFDVGVVNGSRSNFVGTLYQRLENPDLVANNFEGVFIQNNYRVLNNYEADQNVIAGYALFDFNLWDQVRVVTGARVEKTELRFTSDAWDDSNARASDPIIATLNDTLLLDNTDVLPSVNITYSFSEKMILRGAYNRTLARPSFRELAPFASFDFLGDVIVIGNPELTRTLIDNYDLRFEYYPRPSEIFSVSVFYKQFDGAIEQVFFLQGTDEQLIQTWENVDNGRVFGVELEARKSLDFIATTPFFERLNAGANFSYLYSQADKGAQELEEDRLGDSDAPTSRRLFGQPSYTVNAYLNYHTDKIDVNANFNVQGKFLSGVILQGTTPDIFTFPRPTLDFNVSYQITSKFQARFFAENLLNPEYDQRFDYDDIDTPRERFKIGRTFAISLAYKI